MKDTPAGEPRTIVDPNTGTTYTFEGTKDPDTYNTTSDDGTVRVFDKNTSKIISKTEPGAGKTKTQASSVTINAAGARTPVYKDGAQIGYQSYNDKTGKTSFTSFSHEYNSSEEGILPSGSTLGTFAAGNPDKNGTEPTIDWEEAGE